MAFGAALLHPGVMVCECHGWPICEDGEPLSHRMTAKELSPSPTATAMPKLTAEPSRPALTVTEMP